jgi:hypothetical protein
LASILSPRLEDAARPPRKEQHVCNPPRARELFDDGLAMLLDALTDLPRIESGKL